MVLAHDQISIIIVKVFKNTRTFNLATEVIHCCSFVFSKVTNFLELTGPLNCYSFSSILSSSILLINQSRYSASVRIVFGVVAVNHVRWYSGYLVDSCQRVGNEHPTQHLFAIGSQYYTTWRGVAV